MSQDDEHGGNWEEQRCRRRCKTTRKGTKPPRTHYKRKVVAKLSDVQNPAGSVLEDLPSNSSTVGIDDIDISTATTTTTSPCSTPKARRFRIPETDTCPPAPKKQRVVSNYSFQKTPIAFFAPPDLELFFLFAYRDISV